MNFTGDGPPHKCTVMNEQGQLPDCFQNTDGNWEAVYPSADGGGGGGFAVLFFLFVLFGIGITIWKVSAARRMARESGMSEGDATAMTLLTDDGFEATYLASNLRQPAPTATPTPAPAEPEPKATKAERLQELQGLLDQELITQEEYDAARASILGSL